MEEKIQPPRPADHFLGVSAGATPAGSLATVLRHLLRACRILAEKDVPWRVRVLSAARSCRVLLHPRAHAELVGLKTFSDHVAPRVGSDVFHHVNRRHYLVRGLRLQQRIGFLLTHYRFEEAMFGSHYRRRVYQDGGLVLWAREANGSRFTLELAMADRYAAEGDLSVFLLVDGERLHCISFVWASSELARGRNTMVPFITANQGRLRKHEHVQAKFDAAFPQQAANFACYAAMQGIASAIRAPEMLAVSSRLQVCCSEDEAIHFSNAYNIFWDAVGGIALPRHGYALPVPRPHKPLEEVSAKHRKRSAAKRKFWQEITDESSAALANHLRAR